MKLDDYLKTGCMSVGELAEAIGAKSHLQVRQWQHGYAKRKPGPAYCIAIERVTNGEVTRRDLRPDDWQQIWPELIPQGAPTTKQGAANA